MLRLGMAARLARQHLSPLVAARHGALRSGIIVTAFSRVKRQA